MIRRMLAPLAFLIPLVPGMAAGQNVALDENAFRIYLNGEPVGREEFSIRQIGPSQQHRLILRGTVDLELEDGSLSLAAAMEVQGETLGVSTYQIKVTGTENTDIFVNVTDNRYLARIVSASGEQLREFRAGPGSVILDQGVAHQYFLLGPFLENGPAVSLSVLSPRGGNQNRMTLSLVGQEEIRVGGVLVPDARRFHLEGGNSPRDIWFDNQGRILRVEIPSQAYVAERETLS
ncbi:MAG: hypothetical protein HKO65_18050 [Gemmatimonadetes bacterium]|nr:hypothetical protein [Gemmatimonadota bacterium]NNM07002.1 hypothetical protein [Gemmatimonadota bacterium]